MYEVQNADDSRLKPLNLHNRHGYPVVYSQEEHFRNNT